MIKCQKCEYKCNNKGNLLKHQRSQHTMEQTAFKCQGCDKEFKEKGHMRAHYKKKHA